jgi:hypothetical protein
MRFQNLNLVWRLFLPIIAMGFIAISSSCSDSSSDFSGGEWEWSQEETYEYEIGPEGGTIEVKDYSSIDGFTIVIPAGALAQTTKISIARNVDAPDLPNGFATTYYPAIELTSDAPFLKEIQIKFPSYFTPESGKMLCAFYWDTTDSSWKVAMPESFEGALMTVKTEHFSYWEWGELILDDVEDENLYPLLDEAFGPEFMDRLAEVFEVEALKLINWYNWDYCANQAAIANVFYEIREDSRIRAEENLNSVNSACNVWDHTPTVNDIFYGFNELIQIHLNYLGETITAEILEVIPYIGGVLSIMAKANAQALYEQRLGNLKNEYACIFTEAEAELWINIGLYYMADAALLGMEVVGPQYCN